MWWRYIQKENRMMAVIPKMGTREYMRVVTIAGLGVTGLDVAGQRDGGKETEREREI